MEPRHRSELRARVQPFVDVMASSGATLDDMTLAMSAALQPGLDVMATLVDLDELAAECPTPTPRGVVEHLFVSGLFTGDRATYHRWQNSCLDHVVTSRSGMPITLAVVAIEVARRVGVRLCGIGLPGHFLVGIPDDSDWFVDPFNGGAVLTAADCRSLLDRRGVPVGAWNPATLEGVPDRLVVARMLNNVRASCERDHDAVRLAVVMQLRRTMPEFAAERDNAPRSLAVFN